MVNKNFLNFYCHSRKIIAAALNYKSFVNSRKLPIPEKPLFFLKPTSSFIIEGQSIILPRNSTHIVHEVELGVIIGKSCRCASINDAASYIAGYCLALDLTDFDKIMESKKNGHPWSLAKGFDTACPVSEFVHCSKVPDPQKLDIWCQINGQMRQECTTEDMIFPINELISAVSESMTLEKYDLLLTGTPAGTGFLNPSDVVECGLGNIIKMKFPVIGTSD